MAAEAVQLPLFTAALARLDEGKQLEIDFAIYAIEDDPEWGAPDRFLAPADSPYHGYIVDLSVSGFAIVYKVVDQGAAVELWYLHEMPENPGAQPGPRPDRPPMM